MNSCGFCTSRSKLLINSCGFCTSMSKSHIYLQGFCTSRSTTIHHRQPPEDQNPCEFTGILILAHCTHSQPTRTCGSAFGAVLIINKHVFVLKPAPKPPNNHSQWMYPLSIIQQHRYCWKAKPPKYARFAPEVHTAYNCTLALWLTLQIPNTLLEVVTKTPNQ